MILDGALLIGPDDVATERRFDAVEPATGAVLAPAASVADPAHVARACALADEAFDIFRSLPLDTRAGFLDAVAEEVAALGDALVERTCRETGLPSGRVTGELARTTGQLRAFAALVRDGGFLDVRLDRPDPDRTPLRKPDLRARRVPVGPVAVFGASNFPLAFSVAGGDTAAALAAGCPVVVKAHPAHPGASEMVGRAVRDAVRRCGLPGGTFSLLSGPDNALGIALVRDEHIRAVGFTGSRAGGLALLRAAAERTVPIPVFAEMSSVNPVFLLPAALRARTDAIADGFVASVTLGAGQFCTNPGLVFAIAGEATDRFLAAAGRAIAGSAASPMLGRGIHDAFGRAVEARSSAHGVRVVARGATGDGPNRCRAVLLATEAGTFLSQPTLAEEVFGAAALVVLCRDEADMMRVAASLEGQLTATLHLDDADLALATRLLPVLERKAGRLLANGWPTGVEVTHAMVHGGPFPATSDGRSTSVGTMAIERFLRPVCYQDWPADLLPPELRDGAAVPRRLDGRLAS